MLWLTDGTRGIFDRDLEMPFIHLSFEAAQHCLGLTAL